MMRVQDAAPPPTSLPSLSPGEGQAMARAGTEQAVSNLPGASVAAAVRDSQRIGMGIMPSLRAGDYKGAASAFVQSTAAALGAIPGVHLLPGFAGVIKAYHGSPHVFDEFKTSAIGTGEGAQAYGHGLYFAENQGVAKGYQNALSKPRLYAGDRPTSSREITDTITTALEKEGLGAHSSKVAADISGGLAEGDDLKHFRSFVADSDWEPDERAAYLTGIDTALRAGFRSEKPEGALYHVKLDVNHDDLLDWDKPLSEQSPGVLDTLQERGLEGSPGRALEKLDEPITEAFSQSLDHGIKPEVATKYLMQARRAIRNESPADLEWTLREFTQEHVEKLPGDYDPVQEKLWDLQDKVAAISGGDILSGLTGEQVYKNLAEQHGSPAAASAALHAAGIPGIRYLDAGSRGTTAAAQRQLDDMRATVSATEAHLADLRAQRQAALDYHAQAGTPPAGMRSHDEGISAAEDRLAKAREQTDALQKAAEGTHNVVMFDPSLIRIEAVNGQPVPTAADRARDGLSILAHPETWGAK